MKCDKGRMLAEAAFMKVMEVVCKVWQRPCSSKCGGSQAVIYKPSVCLLSSLVWSLLHLCGINNLVAVPTTVPTLRVDSDFKLPTARIFLNIQLVSHHNDSAVPFSRLHMLL